MLLKDLESTNGTFINTVVKAKITSFDLSKVTVFNIADAFDIQLEKGKDYYLFKVIKIYDNELIKQDREYIQNLFNTDFIWLKKYGKLSIDTLTGKPRETDDSNSNEIVILLDDAFSLIDKENSRSDLSLKVDDEIFTDRFTIYLT
jgi:hypothetical protein